MDLINMQVQKHLETLLEQCETMEQQLLELIKLYSSKPERVENLQKCCICLSKVLKFKFWNKEMLLKLNPNWEEFSPAKTYVQKLLSDATDLIPKLDIEGINEFNEIYMSDEDDNLNDLDESERQFEVLFNNDKMNSENESQVLKRTRFTEFRGNCDMRVLNIEMGEKPKVNDICMIASVATPDEFFIHLMNDDIKYLDILSDYLWEAYKHSKNIADVTKKELWDTYGKYFAYEGATWMRVEVLNWFWNKGKRGIVLVELVDYGGRLYTDIVNLRPLLLSVAHFPKLAHRCHFAYLYPPDYTKSYMHTDTNWPKDTINWPKDTIIYLYKIFEDFDVSQYKLTHVNYSSKRKSYAVDMVSTDKKDCNDTIGQMLIDSNCAIPFIYRLTVPKLNYCAILNELKMSFDICDTVYALPYFEPLVRECSPEGKILVKITHIDVPYFYVDIVKKENISESSLASLAKRINNPAKILDYTRMVQVPVTYQIVLAQVNDKWHRAVIEEIKLREYYYDKIMVQVFLVDSGEICNVPLRNLRVIPQEMLFQDFLAVRCKLFSVKFKQHADNARIRDEFSKFFSRDSIFQVEIMAVTDCYFEVKLKTDDGKDVEQMLVDDRLAERII
ncbi:hypothetical protein ILUMI_22311 [Ignelater luminosus]|uniref:Tudor domain-containing protein n=1 Tax=Ignelater luminosus TaxID=2038154 RepID=A0A8K0G0M6_IGNLU|nr:hypothetical protein ILUMI_22311 [Ignelater luminosus]